MKGKFPMTHPYGSMALLFLWLLTLTTAGCATADWSMTDWSRRPLGDDTSTTTPPIERDVASNVDLDFKYRRQATELRDTARLLELEAEFYSRHQEQDRAKRN